MDMFTKSVLVLLSLVIFAGIAFMFLRKTEGFESSPTIVYYFLPQCGWCQKFSPTWEQFVSKVEEENIPVTTVKIDASDDKNQERVEKNNIKGFPHVQLEKGEDVKVFDGERTVASLVNFVKSNLSS